MSKPTLTYFDMHGGRGEATRLTLALAGIDFEDHRISFAEFGETRGSMPLSAVPTLTINGDTYTQSNSMNRYFGKLANLYPEDAWEAFKCDEIMGAVEDITHSVVRTFGLEGDAMVKARKILCDGPLTTYLKFLSHRLEAAGGEYFAANQLTVADLKVFVSVNGFTKGVLDHIPTDLVANVAPNVLEHMKRVAAHDGVASYYANAAAS